jgi:hypothetical protein
MSRTLNDDFEDDVPGGSLDLEKGSHTGAGGSGSGSTNYDGGGMEFDDDPYGEGIGGGSLELDLPQGSPTAQRSGGPGPLPPTGGRSAAPGGPPVPDLGFGPPPAARAGNVPPVTTVPPISSHSAIPSVVPSSQRMLGAERARERVSAPPPPHGGAQPSHAPPQAAQPPPPPARPTAAAVIAKYPDPPPEVWRAPKYALRVILRQLELRSELESLRRRRSPDVPLYEAALWAYDRRTFRLGMAINFAVFFVATFIFFLPVTLRFLRAD